MSMTGNGRPSRYAMRIPARVRQRFREPLRKAIEAGRGPIVLAALRKIKERLLSDPMIFGEQLYTLKALHLKVRQGVVAPVVVDYAVHEEQRIVFVRSFNLLS